jgi:hypothetical protein
MFFRSTLARSRDRAFGVARLLFGRHADIKRDLVRRRLLSLQLEFVAIDGVSARSYLNAWFEIDSDYQITRIGEYWAPCGEPPPWRTGLTERY